MWLCVASTGYIFNTQKYSAEKKKSENMVLSVSDKHLGQNYHIY
jgi:hypothetical protein